MPHTVRFAPSAQRDLKRLAPNVRDRIIPVIMALAGDPRPRGARKLVGFENRYRIRVGDYRIIYDVLDRELLVIVIRIGHRGSIYER